MLKALEQQYPVEVKYFKSQNSGQQAIMNFIEQHNEDIRLKFHK